MTHPLEQRPTIEWHEKLQTLGAAAPAAAKPAAPASGGASGSVGNGAAQGSGSFSVGGGSK